jgi:hypothetical protein
VTRPEETEIDTIRARVEVGGDGVPPDRARVNLDNNAFIHLDLGKNVYPFGKEPKVDCSFYMSCDDLVRTPDAEIALDIVMAEGDDWFDIQEDETVLLGSAGPLVEQPEFASSERMRSLINITERRDLLREALENRRRDGLKVTIGGEHGEAGLAGFTLVTSTYQRGGATGVIGVLGPTRMPYDKIIGLVEHTGRLVEGLLQ